MHQKVRISDSLGASAVQLLLLPYSVQETYIEIEEADYCYQIAPCRERDCRPDRFYHQDRS